MAWYDEAWTKRKSITIDNANVPSTQTDFPVMIRLSDDADVAGQMQYSGNDLLFTSADGTTKLSHEVVMIDPKVQTSAVWSWFSNPRAIRHVGTVDATYTSWVDTAGNIVIGKYNHTTGVWSTFTLAATLEADDHDHASIYIRTDGKILATYAKHNTDQLLRQRISTNAEDISAWGAETTTDVGAGLRTSYSNPIYLSALSTGKLFNFYRLNNTAGVYMSWWYKQSNDEGTTWGAGVEWWDGGLVDTPYMHVVGDGVDTLHFVASNRHPVEGATSLYHFKIDASSGSIVWKQSDDSVIGTALPHTPAVVTLVYDGTTTSGWNWDIAIDSGGNPVIAYATFPTTSDHRYNVTRWTGSAWSSAQVVAGGKYIYVLGGSTEVRYSGGMSLDHADVDSIYTSREVATDTWRVEKYTWSGSAWSLAGTISQRDGKYFRPVVPWNSATSLKLLWCSGYYDWYGVTGSIVRYGSDLWSYPRIKDGQVLLAYVKVPTLSSSADTTLYMYYGNPAATDQRDTANVWDANYLGVWHGQDKSDDTRRIFESNLGRHFVKAAASVQDDPHEWGGLIGRSQRFGHITQNDTASAGTTINMANLATFHFEVWYTFGALDVSTASSIVEMYGATNGGFLLGTGINEAFLRGFCRVTGDVQIGGTFPDLTLVAGTPVFAELLFDNAGGGLKAAKNTVLSSTTYATTLPLDATASTTFTVGSNSADAGNWLNDNALVESFRLSNIVRSGDWRTTQYANQSNPGTFETFGSEESPPVAASGGGFFLLL